MQKFILDSLLKKQQEEWACDCFYTDLHKNVGGKNKELKKIWMRHGEPAHASKCVTLLWCFSLSRSFFGFFLLVREMHTPEE